MWPHVAKCEFCFSIGLIASVNDYGVPLPAGSLPVAEDQRLDGAILEAPADRLEGHLVATWRRKKNGVKARAAGPPVRP